MNQKPYTIIDTATREIVQTGFVPADQMDAMRLALEEGQELLERAANPKTQRVSKSGSIIKKSKSIREREELELAHRKLRRQRRALLEQSDWTQMPDAPVDQAAWRVYRQALRDLPANTPDPRNPTWPEPPQ